MIASRAHVNCNLRIIKRCQLLEGCPNVTSLTREYNDSAFEQSGCCCIFWLTCLVFKTTLQLISRYRPIVTSSVCSTVIENLTASSEHPLIFSNTTKKENHSADWRPSSLRSFTSPPWMQHNLSPPPPSH